MISDHKQEKAVAWKPLQQFSMTHFHLFMQLSVGPVQTVPAVIQQLKRHMEKNGVSRSETVLLFSRWTKQIQTHLSHAKKV